MLKALAWQTESMSHVTFRIESKRISGLVYLPIDHHEKRLNKQLVFKKKKDYG